MRSPKPVLAVALAAAFALPLPAQAECTKPIEAVCFTPGQDCTGLIVRTIGQARSELLLQAYSFTSVPIARALLDAKRRGVTVQAIIDESQKSQRYSELDFLHNQGIPTWIDTKVAIAHNKVMVIDGEKVITGSFNFTRGAQERNAENVVVLCDPEVAAQYKANWERRREVSEPYEGRG